MNTKKLIGILKSPHRDLPQKNDRKKFVLSGTKYNSKLKCLETEKGNKIAEGAKFKHWAVNNFKKTTIGEKEILRCLKTDCY